MANRRPQRPLEVPEFLSEADMRRFMEDPNFRAERRATRRAKIAVPAGGVAVRGYTRDWLFDGVEVPPPVNIDPLLVQTLLEKSRSMPPLTDKITAKYDIYPYPKAAEQYGMPQNRKYLARVHAEVKDPKLIPVFNQAATRSLEHTRDNLQWNLWLKTSIAAWRMAHIDGFIAEVSMGRDPSEDVVRHTGGAIADLGYCLRSAEGAGLLRHVGQDITTAHAIEHIGQYAANGHPEMLIANMGLVEFAQQEQDKRLEYWGDRYQATVEAFGNRLSDEDLRTEQDLDIFLAHLYSGAKEVEE